MDVKNVTVGKPKTAGGIYRAPIGTELPTNANDALNDAFKNVGYINEDGVTNTNSADSSNIKAWGGDIVLTVQGEKADTFKFSMIEALNVDVLKTVFGSSNVSGSLETGIVVKANSQEAEDYAWVIDMRARNDVPYRIVVPDAKISELGDRTFVDEDLVSYETTITAFPDASGNTHYEYIGGASA